MCYVELYDLGCDRVGLKSLMISIDYWIIWAQVQKFERFDTCFCTCALIILMILLQLASEQNSTLNTSYGYLKTKAFVLQKVFFNLQNIQG
jgi:hypothetical protein